MMWRLPENMRSTTEAWLNMHKFIGSARNVMEYTHSKPIALESIVRVMMLSARYLSNVYNPSSIFFLVAPVIITCITDSRCMYRYQHGANFLHDLRCSTWEGAQRCQLWPSPSTRARRWPTRSGWPQPWFFLGLDCWGCCWGGILLWKGNWKQRWHLYGESMLFG